MPLAYVSSQKVQETSPQIIDCLSAVALVSQAVPPFVGHTVMVRVLSRDPVPHDLEQSLQAVQAEYSQFFTIGAAF